MITIVISTLITIYIYANYIYIHTNYYLYILITIYLHTNYYLYILITIYLSETDTASGPGDRGDPSLKSKSILLAEVLAGSIETDLGGGEGT